jgi:prepilin-type N-terminal cleavage/methylation domain-containing protein
MRLQKQSGFTLVEIAIVLVIIGLLLGGILKGQELITNARVRSIIDQGDAVKAAYYAFRDRYKALPGDMLAATANTQLPNSGAAPGGGDGNGQIATNAERGLVWTHLQLAGFINGTYNGTAVAAVWTCPTATCPANAYGSGLMLSFGSEASGTAGNSHELWTGANIPVGIVAEIDRKIDDGIPQTGSFQSGQSAAINPGTCVAGAGTASTYQINVASPQTSCGAVYMGL